MFGLIAMVPGQDHWRVAKSEVDPWADEAATLLARIPTGTADRIVDASAVLTVGVGLASIVMPRMAISNVKRTIKQQEAKAKATPPAPVARGEQVQAPMAPPTNGQHDPDRSGRPLRRVPGVYEGI